MVTSVSEDIAPLIAKPGPAATSSVTLSEAEPLARHDSQLERCLGLCARELVVAIGAAFEADEPAADIEKGLRSQAVTSLSVAEARTADDRELHAQSLRSTCQR